MFVDAEMSEHVASICFWLIVLVPIGVFVRQIQQVRSGSRRKFKAAVLFFSYSILPVLAYTLAFLALVGIEELTKTSMISEGISRTLMLVVGIGLAEVLLLTIIFAIAVSFLRGRSWDVV